MGKFNDDDPFPGVGIFIAMLLVAVFSIPIGMFLASFMKEGGEDEPIRLHHDLKLPMQIRDYTQGETLQFKTEEGMPCIAWRHYDKTAGGGLSCDWDWRERND